MPRTGGAAKRPAPAEDCAEDDTKRLKYAHASKGKRNYTKKTVSGYFAQQARQRQQSRDAGEERDIERAEDASDGDVVAMDGPLPAPVVILS